MLLEWRSNKSSFFHLQLTSGTDLYAEALAKEKQSSVVQILLFPNIFLCDITLSVRHMVDLVNLHSVTVQQFRLVTLVLCRENLTRSRDPVL